MTTKKAFQKFVASTFYKQMLKALRSTQQTVQYMDGGQAEQAFRSQLDQQISEDLAENHGAAFSDSLYESFRNNLDAKQAQAGSKINYLA
ncbi:rod-binding protein [Rubinisphaera italica]|uniref:Rod binding protein n=1 Tax=Rubinisphaera italica TaxID=2527969 RepID=A0A5C5XDF6_9PLAN|nr:rod-binding protein [Rubinisphaera italica]TWT59952.1 Rod binding protein [Rubinisphaera italica]